MKIKRREFIKFGGALTLGASLPVYKTAGGSKPGRGSGEKVKAGDIQAYLRSLDKGWIDLEKTVDTFKSGGPEVEVTGIGVGWMSYTWALKKTLEKGFNMFITHEPTYFEHRDANIGRWQRLFRDLIREDRVRSIPVARIADVMSNLLYGTMFTNFFTGRRKSFEKQAREILDIIFCGILSERERAGTERR